MLNQPETAESCGSHILKVRNRNSATFLNPQFAIVLVVRNIAELRRCGLKLRMPTFACYTNNENCYHLLLLLKFVSIRLFSFLETDLSSNCFRSSSLLFLPFLEPWSTFLVLRKEFFLVVRLWMVLQ